MFSINLLNWGPLLRANDPPPPLTTRIAAHPPPLRTKPDNTTINIAAPNTFYLEGDFTSYRGNQMS